MMHRHRFPPQGNSLRERLDGVLDHVLVVEVGHSFLPICHPLLVYPGHAMRARIMADCGALRASVTSTDSSISTWNRIDLGPLGEACSGHGRRRWGQPQFPLTTGQTTPFSVRLTIMTLAWSMSDRPKASQADVEQRIMARPNRAEVVVADEVGVYHCVQRVVRRAFLCGVDPLSGNSCDHRRTWIRKGLESLDGLFGVEIAAFAGMTQYPRIRNGIRRNASSRMRSNAA